jgi:VWFA-related protein
MSRTKQLAFLNFGVSTRARAMTLCVMVLCAASCLLLASATLAQDAPAQNPPPQNPPAQNANPPSATPPPAQKSDPSSSATAPDNYRPSLLKKDQPATPPKNAPAPNAPPANSPSAATPPAGAAPQAAPSAATPPAPAPSANAAPAASAGSETSTAPNAATTNAATNSAPANAGTVTSSPTPGGNGPSASSAPGTSGAPPAATDSSSAALPTPAGVPAATSGATSAATPAAEPMAEMTTRTVQVPLESHVNLVPVRVIVHDSHGNAVGDLREADFEIRQDGKPQVISHFSVETPASLAAKVAHGTAAEGSLLSASGAPAAPMTLPSRFVALVMDDANLNLQDLMRMKLAAIRYMNTAVKPNERVALFTVSGQNQVDFTDDHAKIVDQLKVLISRPIDGYDPATQHDCLVMTYYQADQIQNHQDPEAIAVAQADALQCAVAEGVPAQAQQSVANSMYESVVAQMVRSGEVSTQFTVRRLDEIVRRISAMPGQRSMVFLSPGFITSTYEYDVLRIVDRAARENVFINTLDARGLYTVDPIGDISQPAPLHANSQTAGLSLQFRLTEQRVQSEVLEDLADSTGGFYFRNNNDLDAGLRQTAAEPAVSYLLAFVPADLKNDGKFHTVNIKMLTKEKYTVQARRGFFAPKHGKTPDELAKQDIEDAVFSQEEQQGLPVQLNLQYFKVDDVNAKLAVLTHVDLNQIRFDRADDRNSDNLTIVAALFDRNGNFIKADQKTLEMHLKDATLEKLHRSGLTVKTNFDVKPGGYMVRLVVRDSKDAQIASRNGVVDIP